MESVLHVLSTTSTNDAIIQFLSSGRELPEGFLIYSDFQTKGRGQAGNSWESEPGKNLTFSIILYPDFIRPDMQFLISQMVSLAIRDYLMSYCGLDNVMVKWPNDIYCGDKKICGILIETSLVGHRFEYAVLGVGLNLNQEVFKSNAPNPVSVFQLTGENVDVDQAAKDIQKVIMSWYMKLVDGNFDLVRKSYFDSLYRKSGFYSFSDCNGKFEASIDQVLDSGQLILKTMFGQKKSYWHKEVEFII